MLNEQPIVVRWEHFQHDANIGIRGIAPTKPQAFEQAALALTAVVTPPESVQALTGIDIHCDSSDDEFLFLDWINALIFEMATCTMLFSHFQVALERRGILVRSPSMRGVAEEASDAYKDVTEVVDAADKVGLARTVARLEPRICIKG